VLKVYRLTASLIYASSNWLTAHALRLSQFILIRKLHHFPQSRYSTCLRSRTRFAVNLQTMSRAVLCKSRDVIKSVHNELEVQWQLIYNYAITCMFKLIILLCIAVEFPTNIARLTSISYTFKNFPKFLLIILKLFPYLIITYYSFILLLIFILLMIISTMHIMMSIILWENRVFAVQIFFKICIAALCSPSSYS